MKLGYARVSTDDQKLDLQRDALKLAGCEKIFEDTESGAKASRPGLEKMLGEARPDDVVVIWRLDRLGRSLKNLIELTEQLKAKSIGLQSLQENIDTSSSGGQLLFHIFGALAEFERNLLKERSRAGVAAARARGKHGGRPKALDPKKRELAVKLHSERQHSIKEICEIMGITKPTLYKYIAEADRS